jgi:HlyD family secretion protein
MDKMKALKRVTAASLVVLLAAAAAGCSPAASNPRQGAQGGRNAARQMSVETQIVKLSDVGGGQVFTGSITPVFTTNLSSRVTGRVASIDVNVGDRVKAGQALAHIDTTTLQQQLETTKSQAAVAQAQYNKAVNDYSNGLASAANALDKAVNDAQAQVESAKRAVAVAQAQLNNAIASQQNAIASAKQGVANAQTSFNSTQASVSAAITAAQNNLNAQLDALLTSQSNNLQTLQLNVQQAAAAYSAALQSNQGVDAALAKLQAAQLALQQAQQNQYKDAQSAQAAAQSQLTSLQNALLQAQSSQQVQVAQEALNAALVSLANAQATAAAQIEVSQQQLAQQETALANAQKSQQTSVKQAEQAYKAAQSTDALKVNEAQLQQAQTNVKQLEEQLEDGVLKSPIDGIVTAIGTPVGQNASSSTPIVTVAAVDPVLATVNVSEAAIGKIKTGLPMTVSVPTLNKTYEGKVYAIHPTMDATSKSYLVDIQLDDPQHELLPGMFATSSLKSEGRQAIMVPADAVISQPSGNAVYIVKDGRAKKVLVKLGAITSTAFEVTSGLQVGDELVVKGQELLSDNVPVVVGQPGQGQGGPGQGQGQRPNGQGGQGQGGQRQGGQGQRQGGQGQRPNGQGEGGQRQGGQGQRPQTPAGGQNQTGGADAGAVRAGAGQ